MCTVGCIGYGAVLYRYAVTFWTTILGELSLVVITLKPAQSSVMLLVVVISSALKSHSISESRVVSAVKSVPQGIVGVGSGTTVIEVIFPVAR